VLTACFLILYGLGAREAFSEMTEFRGTVDEQERTLFGATLLGLAMFGTLFLGAVLAVFLTLGAVRGDAERGLLQPLVVRPIGRAQLLLGRFLAAGSVCAAYVAAVYLAAVAITSRPAAGRRTGCSSRACPWPSASSSWSPSPCSARSSSRRPPTGSRSSWSSAQAWWPGCSVSSARACRSPTLESIGHDVSWALPFEALYQSGLNALTADTVGFAKVAVNLGPFGGARDTSLAIWPWTLGYTALVGVLAAIGFARRDL
jgi:hypothetical protein